MEQIFKEVREYIAQNKNEYGPPVKFDFSKIDYGTIMENFLQKNKVPYFIFSEKQYFLKHELIHISIDQITNRDLKYNLAGRQNMVHQHEFFELFYVYSGKCISTIDEVPVEFHQGDIGLYSPKAIHSMRTPDDGDVVINILIRKKLFEQTFLSMVDNNDLITGFFMDALYNPNSNQKHVVFKKEQTTIAPMIVIQMLYEYKKNDSFSQDILASYFSCLLSDLARSYTHKLSRTIMRRNNIDISILLTYINVHYQTITLEKLAEHFHYSSRSISDFILKETGRTFRETLQNYRLVHACQYLSKTDISLNDLPELVGYSQRSTFERAFKEYFHCTPAQYRKNHQSYG
ncbi:AraC family transcriptional regulator [Massilioclostridium coli]|nr:AraC family transcriptional regulator [Massilioclostridium coli]PWM99060.1 MAG: AraC family transcriptional regulator [Massilioclostridium sp.]